MLCFTRAPAVRGGHVVRLLAQHLSLDDQVQEWMVVHDALCDTAKDSVGSGGPGNHPC